jgi:hypothetical protein
MDYKELTFDCPPSRYLRSYGNLANTLSLNILSRYHPDESEGRVFYSALGDILMRVPFLPLTLNVPDTLSTISGFFSYFTSEESADEPRDVMKLVRSALELTNIDELEEDLFF